MMALDNLPTGFGRIARGGGAKIVNSPITIHIHSGDQGLISKTMRCISREFF